MLDSRGSKIEGLRDARGVAASASTSFPDAVRELRARFGEWPVLLAGMIGSDRGWVEAPYVSCPATLESIAAELVHIPSEDAWIVPGVSFMSDARQDVMRGEEVQLFGAVAADLAPPDGLICHPGTHAKWAMMSKGAIASFVTRMTGEVFALLKSHSILAPQIAPAVQVGDAFLEGVDRSLAAGDLLADLFSVRARSLLTDWPAEAASAFVSGLLIGADVKIGLAASSGPITLVGDRHLTSLYAAAVQRAGRSCNQVDGETAFISGIRALAEKMG